MLTIIYAHHMLPYEPNMATFLVYYHILSIMVIYHIVQYMVIYSNIYKIICSNNCFMGQLIFLCQLILDREGLGPTPS